MTAELKTPLVSSVQAAAKQAGLVLVSATEGSDFHGQPTAVFQLGLPGSEAAGRHLKTGAERGLRVRQAGSAAGDDGAPCGARPSGCAIRGPSATSRWAGCRVAFGQFQWPFHRSTSGADTYIVHGEMHLADGGTHNLHAKIAAVGDADLCRDCAGHGAAIRRDLRLQRGAQDGGSGPVGVREVRQSPAGAGDHALLQPLAEEVSVYRDRRRGAARAICCARSIGSPACWAKASRCGSPTRATRSI